MGCIDPTSSSDEPNATGGSAGAAGAGASDGGVSALPSSVEEVSVIGTVWSGHFVAFALLTHDDRQFAAFYDADRSVTVAARVLGSDEWELVTLSSTLDWNSHKYVTLAVDEAGYVHVSGNMRDQPLVYFRSTSPLDISTLERVGEMVGTEEDQVTCPEFFRGPSGEIIYAYRDGGSGAGNHIFNSYDVATRTWRRLLDTPLPDGEGQRSACPVGPVQGPEGSWHLVWVWRDTPDAATQLYDARLEDGGWVVHQTSGLDYRWDFGGGGTLVFEIEVEPVQVQRDGILTQRFFHAQYGGCGAFRLNPDTLAAEETIAAPLPYPAELAAVESTTEGMQVNWQDDQGEGPDGDIEYLLRWETLPSNRDQARAEIPPATELRLYGIRQSAL